MKRGMSKGILILAVVALVLALPLVLQGSDQAQPKYAYVPSVADGTVSAIDLATNEIAWTLQVGEETAMGIASSPDGRYVYTGDAKAKDFVIIDAQKQEIVSRVPISHGVHAIDVSPNGRYVWVGGGLESYPWLSAISVINAERGEVEAVLSPALGSAAHLAFTPNGKEVWAASITTNLVWVTDAVSGEVTAAIPLTRGALAGTSPEAEKGLIGFNEVAISPDGKTAYAVGPEAAVVYAIDVPARQVISTVQAGERAHGIAVSRDGREVWTADRGGTVTVIDARSLQVLVTIPMGEYANHVAFSMDGRHAYVSRMEDVAVVDTKTRQIIKTIPVGKEPHEISLEDRY